MRPERFEGRIGRTVADSEPWFDEPPHPGEGAPARTAGGETLRPAMRPIGERR